MLLSDTQTCSLWLLAKARSFLFVAGGSEGRDWLTATHLLLSEKAPSTLAASPREPPEFSSPHTSCFFTLGHHIFVHNMKTQPRENSATPTPGRRCGTEVPLSEVTCPNSPTQLVRGRTRV